MAGAVHRWLVDRRPRADEFTLTVSVGGLRGLIVARALYPGAVLPVSI